MIRPKLALRSIAFYAATSAVALLCGAQTPAAVSVHLDPAQTQINWTLVDVLHTVHGTFQLKGGMVTFNPATGEAQGEVLVDAASGQSGSKMRDGKMQHDILQSQKYPQIIFHPAKVVGTLKPGGGPQDVDVVGTFTIHGADHPLTLHVHVVPAGDQLTMTTHFDVPYVAWGMKDPSTLMLRVEKSVPIDVNAHGTVTGLK